MVEINRVLTFGLVVAVLVIGITTTGAQNVLRLEPSSVNCEVGEEVTDVWVYLNATEDVAGFQFHLQYEDDVVDIVNVTSAVKGTSPNWVLWNAWWKVDSSDGHHYLFVSASQLMSTVTGNNIELVKISLKGLNPGSKALQFLENPPQDKTKIIDINGDPLPLTIVNGTFTCTAPPETFTKNLVAGWNLISLPLTNATDMTVANIMSSVNYDALYSYDATAKSWVALSPSDTMANGVGYFIYLSSADTWTYTGGAYTSMDVGLESGLNMIGSLNCSKDISSIAGNCNYVARWNATSQAFEICNPAAPSVFKDFTTMERGEGYFISAKTAGPLTETC